MIGALVVSFTELIARPLNFIPASIAAFLNALILVLVLDNYYALAYDVLLANELAGSNILETSFYLLQSHFPEIFFIGLATFLSLVLGAYVLFVYASLSTGRVGILKSLGTALGRIGDLAAVGIFGFAAVTLVFAVSLVLFMLAVSSGMLSIIFWVLLLGFFAIVFYAGVKLLFAPVIMATEKKNLKQGLGAAWKWSEKRFLGIIIFVVLSSLCATLISGVFFALQESIPSLEIGFILVILGTGLSTAFYSLALVNYYAPVQK